MASVASSVARTCARPASRAVNARHGGFPADLALLWPINPSLVGVRSSAVGPGLTWSYTGAMYDADGVSIGANPPFHAGKGLYSGPAVTNLLSSGAENLSDSYWNRLTASATGDMLVEATGTVQPRLYRNVSVFATAMTIQIEAKAAGRNFIALGSNTSDNSGGYAIFDLVNGVGKVLANTKLSTFSITSLDDGWFLLQVSLSASIAAAGFRFVAAIANSYNVAYSNVADNPITAYTGGGTSGIRLRRPQLTNSPYPVPYVPPGTTQPSAAATTGGNGASIAMDQRILESFRGKPDGVERMNLGQAPVIDNAGSGSVGAYNQATKTISNSVIGTNNTYPRFDFEMGAKVVGERYLCRIEFSDATRVSGVRLATAGTTQELTKSGNVFSGEIVADNTGSKFDIRCDGTSLFSISILSATVQKLAPVVCTVMHECLMGVGSGDLAVATTNHSLLTGTMVQEGVFYFRGEGPSIVSSYDGLSAAFKYSSWSANEIHRRYVQTNATGTKYRVGYQRYTAAMVEITSGIVWSNATADAGATFDGSFNPLQWLRFGLNLTVPVWHRKTWISQKSLTDAEIQTRNKLVRY